MQHRSFLRALPAGVLAALVTTAALAQATIRFDLPAQTLEASLRAISKNTDTNILIDRKLVAGLQAPALKAELSVDQAMNQLLEGTGLTYQYVNEHTIVLATSSSAKSGAGGVKSATPSKPTVDAQSHGSAEVRLAQANIEAQPPVQSAPQATPSESGARAVELQEIVVTAQKRTESMQNVPISISVVSDKLIENLHANSLVDLGGYIPGLQVVPGGSPGQTTLSIRGITTLGGGASTVGTYIDDAPLGGSSSYSRASSFALDLLPYDVQRIEVLRGPQGTLYGASALGGLLKYVMNTPSLDTFEARVGGDLSNVSGAGNAGGGARAWVNTPIIQGQLGMIASYAYESTPGYIDNTQTGQSDQNSVRQQSARLAFLWQPVTDLAVHLGAMYQKIDASGDGEIALSPVTLQPLGGDLTDNNYVAQRFDKEIGYYTATLNWQLGWGDLTSATSYSRSVSTQVIDSSRLYGALLPLFGQPAGITPFSVELSLSKVTQEVRLASSSGGPLEWLVGAFYTHEGSANSQLVTASSFSGEPLPGSVNPLAVLELPSTYKEYAGFGNATWHINSVFDLSGGLRYARNEQTFSQIGLGGPLVGNSDVPGSSAEDVLTYSGGPEFHITQDTMAYVRVASGYQPGGPNFALANVPPTFKSDRTTNYEVGVKSRFWDNRVVLDVDAFDIDWKDIQITVFNPTGISYFANGGTARSDGVEATLSVNPVSRLVLGGTFAYTDAKLTQDVPALNGFNGDPLPLVPRYSGSLQADYSQSLTSEWTGHAGAGLRMSGSEISALPKNTSSFRLPGYGLLDLNMDVSNNRYTLRLFVKNLTDHRAYLNYDPLVNGATGQMAELEGVLVQPRTIGLAGDVRF
jgi:outer membrane receptor protein involved in Fe transport